MNTILATLVALSVAGPARAEEQRQQSSRDWDAKSIHQVEVENPRGETTVRASRDGRIHLVAVKILRHSERRGAAELSRATTLEADPQSGVLRLSVRYPQRREIRLDVWDLVKGIEIPEIEVRLALEVPPATRVTLQS